MLHCFFEEINECSSKPCANRGTCSDVINGYTCACIEGYEGTNCDVGAYIKGLNAHDAFGNDHEH